MVACDCGPRRAGGRVVTRAQYPIAPEAASSLRPYQVRAVDEARQALAVHRSALFVCPTGGGKTFVFAELARLFCREHGRVLVLADREHLVEQAAESIRVRTGLKVGIEQGAQHVNPKRLPDVVCATIQSMRQPGRLAKFKPSAFALIVVDEADLGVAPSYGTVLKHFASARVFGCTATPDRADGQSLGAVFEKVITPLYLGDLITQGYLSPMRRTLVRIDSVTLADVAMADGDYTATDLERVLTHEKALHEVVRPSIELAGARPSIVFAATVKHAEALADVFNRYAPKSAAVIHGKMAVAERRRILSAYERGEVRFLCSCALLLRGVDLPLTSCVVMARPTQSRALYCQAIGRGTRLAPGKADLLVLDFTDNSESHSLVSPVDIVAPIKPEVRERARELEDAQPGCDPIENIRQAERELEADPELRAAILARVTYQTRSLESRKWIDWTAEPLGKMPDVVLAEKLGVTHTAVLYARQKYGIPAYAPTLTRIEQLLALGISWEHERLGQTTDTAIAADLGNRGFSVTARDVAAVRKELKIPGWAGNLKVPRIAGATRSARHDLTGRTIGALKVLDRAGSRGSTPLWRCLCSCGAEITAEGQRLASLNPRHWKRSCGHDRQRSELIPRAEQSYAVILEHRGIRKTLKEWSRALGVNYTTLRERLRRGWSVERTLTPAPEAE